MHGNRITHINDPGPLKVSPVLPILFLVLAASGLGAFFYSAFTGTHVQRQHAWANFLVSGTFFWFLSMGAAAFLAINYIVSAKWFVAIKRVPESLASFSYRGGLIFPLLTILGVAYLYPWANSPFYQELWGIAAPDYPYEGTVKQFWLSPSVHYVKLVAYIVPLALMTFVLVKLSSTPEPHAEGPLKSKRLGYSIFFMTAFALLFSFFAWEMLMSTEPKWFSTMFGVYCFIGAFNASMALIMLLLFYLKTRTQYIPGRQMYDMGTYVMAFSTFMMYIGFSQFMLIWYANLYDETFWYLKRYEGGWMFYTVAIPILKWVIPFFLLMPSPWRTKLWAQLVSCSAILVGQLMDLIYIVYPAYYPSLAAAWPSTGAIALNVLIFMGPLGLFGWSTVTYLSSKSLVPVGDEDLLSSVNGDYLHA